MTRFFTFSNLTDANLTELLWSSISLPACCFEGRHELVLLFRRLETEDVYILEPVPILDYGLRKKEGH